MIFSVHFGTVYKEKNIVYEQLTLMTSKCVKMGAADNVEQKEAIV